MRPEPERRIGWRARFTDPDSRRVRKISLDPGLRTRDQREDWAVRKSRVLAKRRADLEGGATRATGVPIADAVERYYSGHPQLRARTEETYRSATDKFVEWAEGASVSTCDDLSRAKLMGFRERVINEPKFKEARRGRRGQKPGDGRRAVPTINRELRSLRTVLGYLVDLDLFAALSNDDLRRALKQLPAPIERIDYMKPRALQRLLEAAIRHDGATFVETRAEHSGRKEAGSTARYQPIAPFVAFVLLTGMRFGEAIDLEWDAVDLEALDSSGRSAGEVYISGTSKTKRARTVDLAISPALKKLLAAQKLSTGGKGSVFRLSRDTANHHGRRLRKTYGAPASFNWQILRRTCGTFLTNSPAIFSSASAFRSARQLGHSIAVAEKSYLGLERGISPDARSLEAAMQIEKQLKVVIKSMRPGRRLKAV